MQHNVIILIPGLLCDATVWQHQIKYFQQHKIIVPDLSTASTPNEMVAAVLSQAPKNFALAGHSMGGWVALEVMRTAAQRVNKLCLLNTSAALDSAEKTAARHALITMAKENKYDLLIERLLKIFLHKQDCKMAVKEMLERNKHALITQEYAMLQRQDCTPLLNTIHCPTKIIHANQDAVFNISNSELLCKNIPHASLEQIENCGHMSPMEAPDEVTKIMLDWLNE